MILLQVLGIAVALSIDAMVVALCWSATCKHVTTKHIFQFAAAFGFFQFLMPLAGGLAGNTVADLVSSWDHWIAFALLAWVSVSMVREAFSEEEEESDLCQVCGTIPWGTLLTLSVATSLDALAVGFSFAMAKFPILWPRLLCAHSYCRYARQQTFKQSCSAQRQALAFRRRRLVCHRT